MPTFNKYMLDKLSQRQKDHALRSLKTYDHLVDFASNDYLGIAKHFNSGSSGSRLISGNSEQVVELEKKFADDTSFEAALFFNSGFQANVGFVPAIADRNTTIFYDELIHASLRDGVRLSSANSISFKHNNLNHLSEKLKKITGKKLIIVEAVYSMDGDSPDLLGLVDLAAQNNAEIVVDEAHSFGLVGENGLGLVNDLKLNQQVLATIFPLGKAVGSSGCFIAGSSLLKEFLINFCRSFIYSTAPSKTIVKEVDAQLKQLIALNSRTSIFELKHYFLANLKSEWNVVSGKRSAIVSIVFSDTTSLQKVEELLIKKGLFVKAILHPTVKKGQERLRICIHSYNTKKEIDLVLEILNNYH
ncbi:MAG: aminotransferase class I/II-fold pyridoxal phosphate-dependent enzyme [Parvicellaceae bacterium]